MKLPSPMKKLRQHLDLSSLRMRLTLGIATVSALGLGGLTMWTGWQMQQILIATHRKNIQYIADRFPQDVEIYSQMMPPETGLQMAIDNVTTDNVLLWVKAPTNTVTAQSKTVTAEIKDTALLALTKVMPIPELQYIEGRYWLVCSSPLEVKQVQLGKLYIAQDITQDQTMFLKIMGSITIACLLLIGGITIAIALYVRKSLQPLQSLSQLTKRISADRLGDTRVELHSTPREVRELAQTFDKMLVRLSEAWEHQRELASNVSHELRTPLTLVSGYLQSTLRRGQNLTETQREALTIAASEAERTVKLLQDLLDLARADSGNMHFQLQSVALKDLVAEVVEMTRQGSDRIIELQYLTHPIPIQADPLRLRQVLVNLLDNAIKYSEKEKPIQVRIEEKDHLILIAVIDSGIGIPLSQQARIFQRFYRVDEARSPQTGGTGLGLSIVKTLVEGMGGTISVRSQPEKGSTFTVAFPLAFNFQVK